MRIFTNPQYAIASLVVGGALAVVLAGGYFINTTANQIVAVQAERTSLAWAGYIGSQLDRVKEIVAGADLTPTEQDFLVGARRFGRIFRFKLFDRNGIVRLISDDLNTSLANNPERAEDNWKARLVAETTKPYTELKDGTRNADRPNLYAETYVPVFREGSLVAVAEVYIDETAEAIEIKADFTEFGLKIAGAVLLGFCFPGIALIYMLRLMHEQNKKLENAEKVKSDFLAHMSHELRTPLNSIIGFSQMIAADYIGKIETEKYRQYAADIHTAGAHLLTLINDVLDISKIEAGETRVDDSEIIVGDAVHDAIELLSVQASKKNVTVLVDGPDDGNFVRADQRLCKQILINLLDNAIKYSNDDDAVTIRHGTNDFGGIYISIENAGTGIESENLDRVLEPFGQARVSIEVAYEGTGLGLPLCVRLMELHGGTLDIKSELGKKTVVTISFPPERTIQPSINNAQKNRSS